MTASSPQHDAKPHRTHFFINRPLQIHYMIYVSLALLTCTGVAVLSMHFGIWGSVLKEFSNERVQNDLLNAARAREYESARHPRAHPAAVSVFRDVELLTEHQKQIWNEILNTTHKRLFIKYIILILLIAWASIYLTHKIAGPLYRFQQSCRHLSSGDLTLRIHLRKFDEAKEIADSFNQMADQLDQSVGRLKRMTQDEQDIRTLKEKLDQELSRYKTSG
ncbi:MAG: methyl-accepting chemotaxis protein [Candidatus Omnitrophica bacterium]|nr:methyl-accepting chemotaxis protein [Candidatus Omnitrophota bacterium]